MTPILQADALTLGYDGNKVIEGLSFSVENGAYLCIVGENGAGKSTLLKALLGLRSPMSGRVSYGGLTQRDIGYLPQQTAIQRDFPASVREIVRSGALGNRGLRPFYNAAEKKRAEENMEKLGITHLAKRCYRELSGGQQQRTLLARALCATEKLLFLDEPAAGLDPQATQDMYATIAQLHQTGITIIMVSHDIAACVQYAGHVLHVGQRRAMFYGTVADYTASDIGRAYAHPGGDARA